MAERCCGLILKYPEKFESLSHISGYEIFLFICFIRNHISINFLSVHVQMSDAFLYVGWILNLDVIYGITENSGDGEIPEALRNTRINAKSFVIRADAEDRLIHVFDFFFGFFGKLCIAVELADLCKFVTVFYKHTCNKYGFCNRSFGWACCLEGFTWLRGKTVQIQAVIPVCPADQRKLMRTKMVCCVLEGTAKMLKQRFLCAWFAVERNLCIQNRSIAGFFQIGSNCSDQPEIDLMNGSGIPATCNGVMAFALTYCVRNGVAVISAKEIITAGIKSVYRSIYCKETVMVSAFAVFCFMINSAAFDLDFSDAYRTSLKSKISENKIWL